MNGQTTYFKNWAVTVEKDGFSGSENFDPDETWYRETPDLPAKTITLTLPYSQAYGRISGKVQEANNHPLSGATVSAGYYSTITDNQGGYTLATVLVRSYTVTSAKNGFRSQSQSVQVLENQSAELNFTLNSENEALKPNSFAVVYPNPYVQGKSSGEKIIFDKLSPETIIRIYNSSGQLVKELLNSVEGRAEWSLNDTVGGIYLYVISSTAGVKKGKISIIK